MMENKSRNDSEQAYEEILREMSGNVFVAGLNKSQLGELLTTRAGMDEGPALRILIDQTRFYSVMQKFIVAGQSADLVADEAISFRDPHNENQLTSVIAGEDTLATLVIGQEKTSSIITDDPETVADVYDRYRNIWNDSPSLSLRTPPLSRVRETLGEEIGEDVLEDFNVMVERARRAFDEGDDDLQTDEVVMALLASARNEKMLYDISKWGENVGLASKATFSRTKGQLEEEGHIKTEKVPIEVGRPRLRLLLSEELKDVVPERLLDQTS